MTKYHAKSTTVDGIRFASKREAGRYAQLKFMLKVGAISDLILQPTFKIVVNGVPICKYIADFSYSRLGEYVVEDSKGVRTPVYKLKRKLMLACHGIEVLET